MTIIGQKPAFITIIITTQKPKQQKISQVLILFRRIIPISTGRPPTHYSKINDHLPPMMDIVFRQSVQQIANVHLNVRLFGRDGAIEIGVVQSIQELVRQLPRFFQNIDFGGDDVAAFDIGNLQIHLQRSGDFSQEMPFHKSQMVEMVDKAHHTFRRHVMRILIIEAFENPHRTGVAKLYHSPHIVNPGAHIHLLTAKVNPSRSGITVVKNLLSA
jgi:hypothetical protein